MIDSATQTSSSLTRWLTPRRLDHIEQIVIVVLFTLLAKRLYGSPNPFAPLLLIAEATIVFFVLIRRPTEAISLKLGDWLLAITATCAPLLVAPANVRWPELLPLAIALLLLGNCIQISGKLFLRRSFGIAPANRGIKQNGMYRLVRHPIYAGYLLANIGGLMLMPTLFNLTVYAIGWYAQILRLLAEERLLSENTEYSGYMVRTRWRLIPGVF